MYDHECMFCGYDVNVCECVDCPSCCCRSYDERKAECGNCSLGERRRDPLATIPPVGAELADVLAFEARIREVGESWARLENFARVTGTR